MPGSSSSVSDFVEDRVVGVLDRLAQRAAAGDRGAQRLERGRARDLAGAVAAHAVGDRDEAHRVVDEVAVLVAVAHAADVGGGADDESHVTAMSRVTSARSARTAPGRRGGAASACTSGSPFSSVPLREPEVLDVDVAVAPEHARVHLRHEGVVGEHDAAAAAASDGELVVHGERSRRVAPRARGCGACAGPRPRGRPSAGFAAAACAGCGRLPGPARARASRATTTRTTRNRNR